MPCIAPSKDLGMKCIGQDKFQYGEATITKFLESDVECYKCDACGEQFRTKFAQKSCMNHIRHSHLGKFFVYFFACFFNKRLLMIQLHLFNIPELAPFNPYFHEKAVLVKTNLIRYAAAYLKIKSDTKVMCQVCSFVSTGQHAQKACIFHVRKNHSGKSKFLQNFLPNCSNFTCACLI